MNSDKKDDKLLKQLEKLKKEERAKKAEAKRTNYNKLNYPLMCPYCVRYTNINIIYFHFKPKRCQGIKKLLLDEKPHLERDILIKMDKIHKILLTSDKEPGEIDIMLNGIMNTNFNEINI